jgi:DNA-binding NarL/FixJ family response regulator
VATQLADHMPRVEIKKHEQRLLELLARGLRNKEIGSVLNIPEDTVKGQIKRIFGKLNVVDRTEAVVTASQRGIIQLDQAHKASEERPGASNALR